MTANANCSQKQAECSRDRSKAHIASVSNSRLAAGAQSTVPKTSNPDGAGAGAAVTTVEGSGAYDTEFAMALSDLSPTDELTAHQLQSESFQQLHDEVAAQIESSVGVGGYSAMSTDEVLANGFAGGVDEVVTDYMEGSGIVINEKDWMPGGSGAGAGSVDGGQSGTGKGKGGAPETKKGGKKGRSKICAKDGCGAIIDESKRCSRCRLVFYCSRDCQRADWKAHKPKCNTAVEEKAAQDARANKQSRPRAAVKGTGAGAGAGADNDAAEEECPICFDLLVDPLSPCPEQLAQRCCRVCVEKMRKHGLPACPLCRAPMQDADELFYESMQLDLRAGRAVGEAKAGLQRQHFDMLHRVLEVDPHHASAQSDLGVMYCNGEGVKKDAVQAVSWYRKAAVQGDAGAQCNLGYMYGNGKGVKKNAVQAVYWYRKAAVQGDAQAQYDLGNMYREGEGVKKDAVQAVSWYLKAAVQGYAGAQCNLGVMYKKGKGVEKNAVQAVYWYRKAAMQGHAGVQYDLGNMYREGEGVKKDAVQAVSWYLKAAVQGLAQAQYNLGSMYRKGGEGVKKDSVQAMRWYRKAAVQGDADAKCSLGDMYREGEGVKKNAVQAVSWYRKAAVQGHARAQSNLGIMYREGEGVKKNAVQAVSWYREAAMQGGAVAQTNLGNMYGNGEGVKKDSVQAVRWYRKAAEQGCAAAQCNLGSLYITGEGVQQNSLEAESWWQKAADQGDADAHRYLGRLHEQQGEYEAALVHYRAGRAAMSPEEARTCERRCVEAMVRAKQEEHEKGE
jgi:TPR repeat protein